MGSTCSTIHHMTQMADPWKIRIVLFSSVPSLSHVRLFATPWTVALQAPPSMGFSRQEYWRGLPFPAPRDLPHPGNEPRSPALQADSLPLSRLGSPSLYLSLVQNSIV